MPKKHFLKKKEDKMSISKLVAKTTNSDNNAQNSTRDERLVNELHKASQLFREMAGAGCGECVAEEPVTKAFEATKL
jgi:hypothetical protein